MPPLLKMDRALFSCTGEEAAKRRRGEIKPCTVLGPFPCMSYTAVKLVLSLDDREELTLVCRSSGFVLTEPTSAPSPPPPPLPLSPSPPTLTPPCLLLQDAPANFPAGACCHARLLLGVLPPPPARCSRRARRSYVCCCRLNVQEQDRAVGAPVADVAKPPPAG